MLLNLSDHASFGFIATSGDPRTNGNAWLVGTDLNYTTGPLFGRTATPLTARSTTNAPGRPVAGGTATPMAGV